MTFHESLDYINSLSARGSLPGLERICALLSLLGDPQRSLACVHVSGTNGKGSVCAMLSSVLRCEGYSVGVYSSPYVEKINELFTFNGTAISDSELAELVSGASDACDKVGATQYEFLSALAFLYFSQKSPDIVIIECCMGGLLDTTNVIESPVLSVITSVALDHTSFLGNSVAEIARHKAGIIKKGSPCVAALADSEAFEVIERTAQSLGAPLHRVLEAPSDTEVTFDGTSFTHSIYGRLHTSLVGVHQAYNATTVVECCRVLSENGFAITADRIRPGLENARLKARFEIFKGDIRIIYDGGHNVHGIRALTQTLKRLVGTEKITMLSCVMKDKEYKEMAKLAAPFAKTVYTAAPLGNTRALDPLQYSEVFADLGVESCPCDSVAEALRRALEGLCKGDTLLVFGSLYAYKEFTEELEKILNL